jgi:hypothetical protein
VDGRYEDEVVALEAEMIDDIHLPMSHILHRLAR